MLLMVLFCLLIGQNENNAPVIMYSTGGTPKRISTDGIDFLLSEIKFPEQSSAFFYRQDGHLFYQLTFYNPVDNLTLAYDFNTSMFFNLTDEKDNFYPFRQIVYFNKKIVGLNYSDGNLYEIGSYLTTYNYGDDNVKEIPRRRVPKVIRMEDAARFRPQRLDMLIEHRS